jgi:ABC-2 type transport system permease protein
MNDAFLRYIRLYGYFLRFAFSRAMQFRFEFWFRMLMDAVYYVIMIATYQVLYLHTATLGGFSLPQAMVFVGATVMIDAIAMTVYSNGIWWIPNYINKGDLDYYLVRPISTLFFVTLREFAAASFLNLLMAAGILSWALAQYPEAIPAWKIAYGALLIFNGAFLMYMVRVMIASIAFWSHSGDALHHIFFYLREAMERPDGIYRGAVRLLFLTALPFALMSSFPTRVFVEPFSPERLLHIVFVTAGLFMVMLWIWKRGTRAYASASS